MGDHMKYCPKCHNEYEDETTRCVDCHVSLVLNLSEAGPKENILVCLKSYSSDIEAQITRGFLETNGFTVTIKSKRSNSFVRFSGKPFEPDMLPYKLMVPKEYAENARKLLAEVEGHQKDK